jgi:mRNA-degrading endonuclease RelE of RelBE toxin-antitoxin system
MNYKYNPSFLRDAKKITPDIQISLADAIENIKSAQTLNDISNLKKLKGHKTAYRIKVNSYRLCFYYGDDKTLILCRFLPRKDVYRSFP